MALVDPTTLRATSPLGRRLKDHVEYLASPALQGRKPGTAGNREAAKYISARFRELGLESLPSLGGYGQTISAKLGENLIAFRPGLSDDSQAPWLLVGAHFDHLGGNYLGADDNAAAVAILLETARALPRLARHHLLFLAFNTEEPPYIRTSSMGSRHFVDHLPREIGGPGRIRTAIVMDLMGGAHWSPLRETIFAGGAEKSPALYRHLKEAAGTMNNERGTMNERSHSSSFSAQRSALSVLPVGMHLVEEIPLMGQVAFSDYDAFRNARVPFVFLSAGRTPRYHQPTDLPDTLHYERMAATVGWLTNLMVRLDQDRAPYEFHHSRIEFADEAASLAPLIRLAAEPLTMIPGTSTLSLWKMQADRKWLDGLDPASPTPDDLKRLERASLRMQCLLADFPGCFLL
jgi:hypothetical protein